MFPYLLKYVILMYMKPKRIEQIDKIVRDKLIIQLYNDGITPVRIARIFKIPLSNVSRILNGSI